MAAPVVAAVRGLAAASPSATSGADPANAGTEAIGGTPAPSRTLAKAAAMPDSSSPSTSSSCASSTPAAPPSAAEATPGAAADRSGAAGRRALTAEAPPVASAATRSLSPPPLGDKLGVDDAGAFWPPLAPKPKTTAPAGTSAYAAFGDPGAAKAAAPLTAWLSACCGHVLRDCGGGEAVGTMCGANAAGTDAGASDAGAGGTFWTSFSSAGRRSCFTGTVALASTIYTPSGLTPFWGCVTASPGTGVNGAAGGAAAGSPPGGRADGPAGGPAGDPAGFTAGATGAAGGWRRSGGGCQMGSGPCCSSSSSSSSSGWTACRGDTGARARGVPAGGPAAGGAAAVPATGAAMVSGAAGASPPRSVPLLARGSLSSLLAGHRRLAAGGRQIAS